MCFNNFNNKNVIFNFFLHFFLLVPIFINLELSIKIKYVDYVRVYDFKYLKPRCIYILLMFYNLMQLEGIFFRLLFIYEFL